MPNWADNQMIVTGKTEEMDRFKKDFGCFNDIVPLDGEWEYDKAVETWGVKWDVNPDEVDYGRFEEGDYYSFMTPWGPPSAFVRKASRKYDLRFTLKTAERGAFFMNKENFENGQKIGEAYATEREMMKELFSGDFFFRGWLTDMELVNHES